jgi:Flp pilus assembly pilin Flp
MHGAILAFVSDERGAESVEFGMVALVAAWTSARLRQHLDAALDAQVEVAVEEFRLAG